MQRTEGWQATEKPDINTRRKGWKVGGQQKNQSLRGMTFAAARAFPFKFYMGDTDNGLGDFKKRA